MAMDAPPRESPALTIIAIGAIFLLIVVGAVYLLVFNPPSVHVSSSSGTAERFSFDAQCQADNQHCAFTVSNDAISTHNLTAHVTGSTPAGAVISPTTASIKPGESATFTIAFPARACQAQITFNATYPQEPPPRDMPFDLPMPCGTPTAGS